MHIFTRPCPIKVYSIITLLLLFVFPLIILIITYSSAMERLQSEYWVETWEGAELNRIDGARLSEIVFLIFRCTETCTRQDRPGGRLGNFASVPPNFAPHSLLRPHIDVI